MAYFDATGGTLDIKVSADVGFNQQFTAEDEDKNSEDITGLAYTMVLADAGETDSYDYTGNAVTSSYSATIDDAANGLFTLYIPATYFSNRRGQEITYQVYRQATGENPVQQFGGTIRISEAL